MELNNSIDQKHAGNLIVLHRLHTNGHGKIPTFGQPCFWNANGDNNALYLTCVSWIQGPFKLGQMGIPAYLYGNNTAGFQTIRCVGVCVCGWCVMWDR